MTKLNCKFGGYSKTKKLLVIVCSNYTIKDCYHSAVEKDSEAIAPLEARFRTLRFNLPPIVFKERE